MKKLITSLYQKLKALMLVHKSASIIAVLGLLISAVVFLLRHYSDVTIPWYLTLFRLIGLLLCSLAAIMLSARLKKTIIANIGMVFFLLIGFELTCFFLLGMPDKAKQHFALPDLPDDHIGQFIGTVPYADTVMRDTKVFEGDTLFDVHYTFDGDHIRVTPDHSPKKDKYAVFFGCSIAFGYGLEDNETFPYWFQKNSEYNSYNMAYNGYGTNQMLGRMEYQNLREYVEAGETNGVGVYVFFWDHIERAIGSMARYTGWLSNAPYYTMDDGKLIRKKQFRNGRPVISKMYELLNQSSVINYFDVALPSELNDNHFDLVSEMVAEAQRMYKKQFGNDNFYMVIYPSYVQGDPKKYQKFLSYLKKKNVKYIDLSAKVEYKPWHAIHAEESHPNAATNDTLSRMLLDEINKMQ